MPNTNPAIAAPKSIADPPSAVVDSATNQIIIAKHPAAIESHPTMVRVIEIRDSTISVVGGSLAITSSKSINFAARKTTLYCHAARFDRPTPIFICQIVCGTLLMNLSFVCLPYSIL